MTETRRTYCGLCHPCGGAMRVLLISANTERMNTLPLPLGLAMVAAAVRKAGHEVVLLNLMFEGDTEAVIRERIKDLRPQAIGISVRNIDDQNMDAPQFLLQPARRVVAICQELCDAPIVVGGAGYSIFPESALRYLGVNMGIRGEGETTFLAVLQRIERLETVSGLPGVYLPGQPPPERRYALNLDEFPLPDPEVLIPSVPRSAEFLGSRAKPARLSHGLQFLFDKRH